MVKATLTMFCFCITWSLFGQVQAYLDLGAGLNVHKMKDDAMSPVSYHGVLPTLALGVMKEKPGRRVTELRFPIQYGTIHAKDFREYPTMKGPLFRFDIEYTYLRHTRIIKDSLKGTFFFGGAFQTMISFRFMQQLDNSAVIYDYSNALGLSAGYRRSFQWKNKRLTQFHTISLPVIALATRPDYMNAYDVIAPGGNDPVSDAFSRIQLRSWGSFQRVTIRNRLMYPIRGTNLIGLTYEWQFYGASFEVPVKAASHLFMFSLLVNI